MAYCQHGGMHRDSCEYAQEGVREEVGCRDATAANLKVITGVIAQLKTALHKYLPKMCSIHHLVRLFCLYFLFFYLDS